MSGAGLTALSTHSIALAALRVHDNAALVAAAQGASVVYPVFVLDPTFLREDHVGVNRMSFLLESLHDLDQSLRAVNSRLFVVRGSPADVLPQLFEQWTVKKLAE